MKDFFTNNVAYVEPDLAYGRLLRLKYFCCIAVIYSRDFMDNGAGLHIEADRFDTDGAVIGYG